jgi:predicted dehydrogenase
VTPVRAAIVGAGQIADAIHLPAMRELGLDLVAAVEVDPDRLTTFCDRWDITGRYADLSAMLAAERPELVVICTPPSVHRDQVVEVLESGAWAWCEKPPALSLAEYDDITAAERDGGPYAPIVFQQRFGSAARHARALLTSGALGRPLAAHCQTTWWRGPDYFAAPWRGSFSGDGGPAMALGIHQIDLLLTLLGPWQELHAFATRLARDIETDDVSTATVRFESGVLATIVTSAVSPRQVSNLRIDTELATVEATYLYSYGDEDWTYTPASGVDDAAWAASAPPPQRSGHAPALRSVLADIEAGRRPETSGPGGRAALELIAALYKSALTGVTVKRGEIVPGDPFYDRLDGAGRPDSARRLDGLGDHVPFGANPAPKGT